MSRRKLRLLVRTFLSLFVIAAMGSSTVHVFASEYDQTEISVEESGRAVYEMGDPETGEDLESTTEASDNGDQIEGTGSDALTGELDETEELPAGSKREDVCFFIIKGIDRDIPYEPAGHLSSDYSEAMRVNGAIEFQDAVLGSAHEDQQDALDEDGYTIKNEATEVLSARPSLEQLQEAVPEFNPSEHYIVWYVIKRSTTADPNGDVTIHVDGVIKKRVYSEYIYKNLQPDEPADPKPGDTPIEEPIKETVSSDYRFNIYTKNFAEPFEYDGEEHIIGGYVIEVLNKETGELLAEFDYGPYGNRIGLRSGFRAANSDISAGTRFSFNGESFRVNVDGAYLSVKTPDTYNIPFLMGGQVISPDDILIWDESGKLIDTGISKNPKEGDVTAEVPRRSITITAGTTVQNDNGQTLTNDKVSITSGSLVKGHRLVTTILGSQTGPGASLNEITSYDIFDENGESVKGYYNVTIENGRLVVVAVSGDKAGRTNSTGSAVTSVLVKDNGETVVNNTPVVLGASRDENADSKSVDEPAVLGARRGETSDSSFGPGARLSLIVLCLMAIMLINIKRNKQN